MSTRTRSRESTASRARLGAILRPLFESPAFWLVCVLAFGATLLRETFNLWTPTYFVQFVGLLPSVAASRSALFPLCGGVSVLLGGFLSDKLGSNGRNLLMSGGMAACTVCLVLMGRVPGGAGHGCRRFWWRWSDSRCSGHTPISPAPCRSTSAASAAAPPPPASSTASATGRVVLGRHRGAHQRRVRMEHAFLALAGRLAADCAGGADPHGIPEKPQIPKCYRSDRAP